MKFSKATLMVLFGVSIAIANVTAMKIAWFTLPIVGSVAIPAGFVAIGVAFLCSDLLAELHGRDVAHATVNATVVALIAAFGLIHVSILMPAAPTYGLAAEFGAVLGGSSPIVIAAIVTTLVSQNIDVSVFHYLDQLSDRRWVRNVGSTSVSQLVDTTLFIALGFVILPLLFDGSAVPLGIALSMVVGQYVVKLFVALLDTPIFLAITSLSTRMDWGEVSTDP